MICKRCARAVDSGAPASEHCADPGCTCGHRPPDPRAVHYQQQLAARARQQDGEGGT